MSKCSEDISVRLQKAQKDSEQQNDLENSTIITPEMSEYHKRHIQMDSRGLAPDANLARSKANSQMCCH